MLCCYFSSCNSHYVVWYLKVVLHYLMKCSHYIISECNNFCVLSFANWVFVFWFLLPWKQLLFLHHISFTDWLFICHALPGFLCVRLIFNTLSFPISLVFLLKINRNMLFLFHSVSLKDVSYFLWECIFAVCLKHGTIWSSSAIKEQTWWGR